ncbi:hypothetical protein I4U23_030774 [Adineta vaga]|nr:hypothetical protein I4U23_030774 [Adineta vaga]
MNKNRSDHRSSKQMNNLTDKRSSHKSNRTLSPSSRRLSTRSANSSNTSHSRTHPSIQMEPGLQALLTAEGQAAEMIARARAKRNELVRQAHRESQAEIEAFRQERIAQYKFKLHEATQLEQYQIKLDADKRFVLAQLKETVKRERKALVDYLVHCVIDQIPVEPHPNTKRIMFEISK